ncbi:MAG: hypothetical protein AAFZ15_12335 [Bacteroidota bacterium]
MEHTKASIRTDIGEGRLESAIAAALEYAEYCGLTDIANALTTLNGRASDHQNKWDTGQVRYEDHAVVYAQLTHHITLWVDRLPDVPARAGKKKKFLTEDELKKKLFYRLLFVKIVVLAWLTYLQSAGGFTKDQYFGTLTLLVTTLLTYVTVIVRSYLKEHRAGAPPPRYMSGPLVTFSRWLLPLYGGLLLVIITLKTTGALNFNGMNVMLGLVEVGVGGYLGEIVNTLFKKGD